VTPAWFFCGQAAVRSLSQSVSRAAGPRSSRSLPAVCRTFDAQDVELAD
jgi:hypothetical protein